MKKCPQSSSTLELLPLRSSLQGSHLALDQPVFCGCISRTGLCLWAGASVHRLSISWTSTIGIYAIPLGFLTYKTLGCEDKMDTGSKATPSRP